jgi:release factor glutamine methyltransferase
MKYSRHYTIDNYLQKVRKHTEPYTAVIAGLEIFIFPNVMSPKYDRSAQMIISMMPNQKNRKVLEIGCGTGILSLHSALQGSTNITAVDINPLAVENAKENLSRFNIHNSKVVLSDLFEKVTGIFDTIIFNAPFHGNQALDVLELGTSDYNYETLTRFFFEAPQYLEKGGYILLGFANTGDNELVHKLIKENDLEIKSFQTYENGDWVMYLYTLIRKNETPL